MELNVVVISGVFFRVRLSVFVVKYEVFSNMVFVF